MKHHYRPPELKLTAILVGLAICLYGCSTSYTVSSAGKPDTEYAYQEMNQELNGRHVTIEMKNGSELSAAEVTISNDSVSWINAGTADRSTSVARSVKRIAFKNHLIGALEGLGFGLIGGGGLGALVGNALDRGGGDFGSGFGAAVGFIIGGGAGVFLGTLTGAGIGHSYNYEFTMTEQSDSLQNGK